MKTKIVTALTGFFVYWGILLFPVVTSADTLADFVQQLNSVKQQLDALEAADGSTTAGHLQTKSPQESTNVPAPETYTVIMTGYNAVPEQTDGDPNTTASGAFSNPEIIAARSMDLADELPYGTVIAVTAATTTPNCGYDYVSEKIGLRVIGDSMAARMRNKIDILLGTKPIPAQEGLRRNPAKALGFCRNVRIEVVGHVDMRHIPKTQTELAEAVGLAPLALNK